MLSLRALLALLEHASQTVASPKACTHGEGWGLSAIPGGQEDSEGASIDDSPSFQVFHASFFDFLVDSTRSGVFLLNLPIAHQIMAEYLIHEVPPSE